MKIVVADKISKRGFARLRGAGWEVVTPAADALANELAGAEASFRFAQNQKNSETELNERRGSQHVGRR
jgi:hypothetical protein